MSTLNIRLHVYLYVYNMCGINTRIIVIIITIISIWKWENYFSLYTRTHICSIFIPKWRTELNKRRRRRRPYFLYHILLICCTHTQYFLVATSFSISYILIENVCLICLHEYYLQNFYGFTPILIGKILQTNTLKLVCCM